MDGRTLAFIVVVGFGLFAVGLLLWGLSQLDDKRELKQELAACRRKCENLEETARLVACERDFGVLAVLLHIFKHHQVYLFGETVSDTDVMLYENGDSTSRIGIAILVSPRQLKRWLLRVSGVSTPWWLVSMAWASRLYPTIMGFWQQRAEVAKTMLGLELGLMSAVWENGDKVLDIYLMPRGIMENRNLTGFWRQLRKKVLGTGHAFLKDLK